MTPDPQTVEARASLQRAYELMAASRIRHLPVVDESARLVGILSDRAVREAIGFDMREAARLTVAEIMVAEPATLAGDATLPEALAVFHATRHGALPVVRSGALIGIITRSDILRAFHDTLGLDVEGECLEIALPNGRADLAHAFQALTRCECDVTSAVVSRMRRDGGEPSLYLRVAAGGSREVERSLREAALILLDQERL